MNAGSDSSPTARVSPRPRPWESLGILPLFLSSVWVLAVEAAAAFWHPDVGPAGRLWLIGLIRMVQSGGVMFICIRLSGSSRGLNMLGLDPAGWRNGVITGIQWTLGFGGLVLIAAAGIWMVGRNPAAMVRFPMPDDAARLAAFLAVGGVIGPMAEELVFRGLVYGGLRRWGVVAATCGSAAIFALLHSDAGPVQAAGGILFALCYERAGHLSAPILVHICGNLALFSLSLLPALF